jgi:hypothetical protein
MYRMRWLLMVVPFLLVGLGCAKEESAPEPKAQAGLSRGDAEQAMQDKAKEQGVLKQPGAPVERKIVYTATVKLVVADFGKAEQDLEQLAKANKGYMSQAEVSGAAGGSRQGLWKVRIPVARFNEFREAIKKLGELIRYASDANDVTEEYYDLEARIKNKEAEVADLRNLHDKGSAKIDDVLAVKRELKRATEELDQLKARQRVLENLIELTTVTVEMHERGTYMPPESPTFDTTIGRTFAGSIDALVAVGKALVLVMVALTPWLPVIAVFVVPLWWIRRRHKAALTRLPVVKPAPPPTAEGSGGTP